MLVMDVDGTLTDGKINISENGEIFKSFSVKDGYGIKLLIEHNIIPVIITGRKSKIIELRAQELHILEVYQDIADKKLKLMEVATKYDLDLSQIAYIGDDLNDLDAISCVGISYEPADAVLEVKKSVKCVLQSEGGNGAVRECIDHILDLLKG